MHTSTVSARKYRPSLFSEVRNQPQVITTLRNQLRKKKVPQVVLFCGPRGSGKTSSARIFAKAINCTTLEPSGEPCKQCTSCQQFQQGTSMNIHELDAASNNSVDDARQLLEKVRYHPTSGKKVFIIDEVHMLSNAAFNALLKTLEEPPAHVIFILATTEKHKIIPTILSRCQVFDFHPIIEKEICAQLQYIAQQEEITADEEALHLISEQSEGSFREALHAFDKIVAFSGGKTLTKEDVLTNLQIIDHTHYFSITDALYQGNISDALQLYDQILRLGFESQYFIKGLSKHLRDLLVTQTGATAALLNAPPNLVAHYTQQAERITPPFLYQALTLLEQCELHYKARQDKRLHVEITLIKLAHLRPTNPTVSTSNITSTPSYTQQASSQNPPPMTVQNPVKTTQHTPNTPYKHSHSPQPTPPKNHEPAVQKTSPSSTPVSHPTPADVTLAQVKIAWDLYKESLKQKNAISAYTTMQSPITLDKETITLSITNTLQKDALRPYQKDLLAFLNEKLGTQDLRLTMQVAPLPEKEKKPYTAQEQLKNLIARYPAIQDLQESLELI